MSGGRLVEAMGLNKTHLLRSSPNQRCTPPGWLLSEETSAVHGKNQGVLDLSLSGAKIK